MVHGFSFEIKTYIDSAEKSLSIKKVIWLQDDLTVSMVEKCKQSQPVVQRIVESTINDEGMLFEALYLHDELQQVISKYEEMEAKSTAQLPENPNTAGGNSAEPVELNEAKTAESPKGESGEASNDQKSI